jgi:hypothetical protein
MSGFLDGFGAAPPQNDDGADAPSAWPSLTEPTRLVPLWPPAQQVRAPAAAPQPQFQAPAVVAEAPVAYPTAINFVPDLALSARDDLDFAPTPWNAELRAMIHEYDAAQTPASEAASARDRIEAALDAFARERGLSWQGKQNASASSPRNSPVAGTAEDTSEADVEDARAALERRAAELGIDVDADTPTASSVPKSLRRWKREPSRRTLAHKALACKPRSTAPSRPSGCH